MESLESFLNDGPSQNIGVEMKGWKLWRSRITGRWTMFRNRWIPTLVWRHQEIDVSIGIRLTSHSELDALGKVESILGDLGLSFDAGYGGGQRDWEWDWSLKGPVSIRFQGVRKTPRELYGTKSAAIMRAEHGLILTSGLLKDPTVGGGRGKGE